MLLLLPPASLLAVLFLLTGLISSASADHLLCDDPGPGDGKPDAHGFTKFCDTKRDVYLSGGPDNRAYAQYICNNTEIRVADWNVLRAGILEVGTPCNGGGYAKKTACGYVTWSVCVHGGLIGAKTTKCRYFDRYNDCEWPEPFQGDDLIPTTMSIWHK